MSFIPHEAPATIVDAKLINRHDARMLELPCNPSLLGEATYFRSVGPKVRVEDLDGNIAQDVFIEGPDDDARGSVADDFDLPVAVGLQRAAAGCPKAGFQATGRRCSGEWLRGCSEMPEDQLAGGSQRAFVATTSLRVEPTPAPTPPLSCVGFSPFCRRRRAVVGDSARACEGP